MLHSSLTARTQAVVTVDHHGPVIGIVTVICLVWSAFAVVGRLFNRFTNTRTVDLEDGIIFTAFIFASAQSAAILVASTHGLGDAQQASHATVEKAFYAASILYVATIFLTQFAIIIFLRNLTPIQSSRSFGIVVLVIVGAWAIASEVRIALQCPTHSPWQDRTFGICFDVGTWDSLAIFNIVTDIGLTLWPLPIIAGLAMPVPRKLFISLCFTCRLLPAGAAAALLAFQQPLRHAQDKTSQIWAAILCLQISQSMSIITACTPQLVTFFGSLVSGMLRADFLRRQHGSFSGAGTNQPSKTLKSRASTLRSGFNRSKAPPVPSMIEMALRADGRRGLSNDGQDQISTCSRSNIIAQRTDLEITAEHRYDQSSGISEEVPRTVSAAEF